MIKNDRQYRITKAQLRAFEQALRELPNAKLPAGTDPALVEVQQRALESQRDELIADIQEYETLLSGKISSLVVEDFAELPVALIKARVALGLTQKDLAERLELKEQQVQRWEATDYFGASVATLSQVMSALGVETREEFYIPNERLDSEIFLSNLARAGLPKDFVLRRLLPSSIAATFQEPKKLKPGLRELLRAAGAVSRIYGAQVSQLMSLEVPALSIGNIAAPSFKWPGRHKLNPTVTAYTVYAHYLAGIIESCVEENASHGLPKDYHGMHRLLTKTGESITFRSVIDLLWKAGIIVLPLKEAGEFHGAVWKIRNHFVIVLKQNTPLESRWLYDSLHEGGHIARGHVSDDTSVIEEHEISPDLRSKQEEEANEWAEDVLFGGRSDEIEEACRVACDGRLQRLKAALPEVAQRFGVNLGSLANHLAYRLASEGKNWWGAAHNLQQPEGDPFSTARDALFAHVNLQRLNNLDRDLLMRAVSED